MLNTRGHYSRKHLHRDNNIDSSKDTYENFKKRLKHPKNIIKKYAKQNFKKKSRHEMKIFHLLIAFFDFKVERQFIIGQKYIADLCIPKQKVIIEVDGEYHNTPEQQAKDKIREDYIKDLGFEIIRFSNLDVENNLLGIAEQLQERFPSSNQKLDNEFKAIVEMINT